MTAGEMAGACIAAAILLLAAATHGWDRWHKRRTDRRFQQTARTDATVAEDVAATKAARRQQEAADDLTTCLAIWDTTPHDTPHQTRRTEDPQ